MEKLKLNDSCRFLFFSCAHSPYTDPAAIEFLLQQIRDYRPHVVICGGDLYEANAASKWAHETQYDLIDEYRITDQLLKAIREEHEKALYPEWRRMVFLPGNHDDNILAENRIPKELRGLCDWRTPKHDTHGIQINKELLTHWEMPAQYIRCRRRGCFRLGEVVFAHGYQAGVNAGKMEAVYFANEYGLYVHGHTHRPVEVTQVSLTLSQKLRFWYANAGTLGPLDPSYVKRQVHDAWGQAVVVGEVEINKSPRRSRTWNAETRIFRMYDDLVGDE